MFFRNFFVRASYFDASAFEGRSIDEAGAHYQQLLDESSKNLQANSEKAIAEGRPADAKKMALDAQKFQQDLSLAYNTYIVSKTDASAPHPSPPSTQAPMAPAPEVMAPAPEVMQAPMAPAVSTFEPEPYY